MYTELTEMTGDNPIVSTGSETEWLDSIIELEGRLYLSSVPPILYQTKTDRRMQQYTQLAFQGRFGEARRIRDSLDPARHAIAGSRAPGAPHAQQKYWKELLGQIGGSVRRPLLPLSESERAAIGRAFEQSGLSVHSKVQSATA
jgi:4-hydroxy-tetrahydrodipicolinate synthase